MSRVLESFMLDLSFLRFYPRKEARELITKKYLSIAKDIFFGFKRGTSATVIFGKKYYHDEKLGMGFLYSLFAESFYFRGYLPKHPVIIDVGANVGQFSFFCQTALQAKKVISFEPIPECQDLLKLNGDEVYEGAVSTKKEVVMHYNQTEGATFVEGDEGVHEVKVKGIQLDTHPAVKDLPHIDLLKIDTEGSEYDVLQSALKILPKVDHIVIEVSTDRPSTGDVTKVVDFLANHQPKFLIRASSINNRTEDFKTTSMDLFFVREGL